MNYTGAYGPRRDCDCHCVVACDRELRPCRRTRGDRAHAAGPIPTLHQLLFVILGHLADDAATVVQVADALQMRHHSVVELDQRFETAGLIGRERRGGSQRLNHRHLAPRGTHQLTFPVHLHLRRVCALADAVAQNVAPIDSE